jgi:phosphatidylglycerol:prolipoprotein diacylglycerol transferase
MNPILLTVFNYPIYAYGVLIALSILLGYLWIHFKGKHLPKGSDAYLMGIFWIVATGFIGARLLYVIYFPDYFMAAPEKILLERGGLVWYGGLIGGTLAGIVYVRLAKIPAMCFADVVTAPILIGLTLGRIGCFLTGCCYGKPCILPWAVQFPVGHETYPHWVHPTQLYESLLVFILLLLIETIPLLKKSLQWPTGWKFSTFLMGYGLIRFVVEMFRADTISIGLFSASQWISLLSFMAGLILIAVLLKIQNRQSHPAS